MDLDPIRGGDRDAAAERGGSGRPAHPDEHIARAAQELHLFGPQDDVGPVTSSGFLSQMIHV